MSNARKRKRVKCGRCGGTGKTNTRLEGHERACVDCKGNGVVLATPDEQDPEEDPGE